jgi:anion-transporting  ArsA/GET3 family ATPase
MAKPKGHRANKPNDSFGTINSETLYRGKYRDEVYEDDDENTEEAVEAADPSEEATPEETSFVQEKSKDDGHDYKKRYDDLKRHYDSKVNEFKQEIDELKTAVKSKAVEMPNGVRAPQTQEELEEFKQRYPDVYEMVQSVSSVQTEATVAELRQELDQIKGREKELEKQKAYEELLRFQPDFDELKADQKFLDWLEEQPASISDGIYKNNTDARWAARVVDLYKADTGSTKKQSKKASAAEAVTKTSTRDVKTNATDGKKIWKVSEIGKLKPWQFEKFESELDEARAEGRIDYNS